MTQDEIIAMAREAGFDEHHAKFDTRIECLVKLVAAHEREECAKVCDDKKEKIGDPLFIGEDKWRVGTVVCTNLAAAIRQRGEA